MISCWGDATGQVTRAFKTELDLTQAQSEACLRHAGAARWAWNWALARKKSVYETEGRVLSVFDLHKELKTVKKSIAPWLYEVSSAPPLQAIWDLGEAYKNFFEKRARYPRFKSRKRARKAFRMQGDIKIMEKGIKLRTLGVLRVKEHGYLPVGAHVLNATISEGAGRWYISVCVEDTAAVAPSNGGPVVGVDLGISSLATISDGTVVANPKALARFERRLIRQQRQVSRKRRDSNNRNKAIERLRRTYARIVTMRTDAIHKATTMLTRTKSVIVVEDLRVELMMRKGPLAKSLADASMREFIRQLEYKGRWNGAQILVAPEFFPSSKTCSRCGNIKSDLALSDRVYVCEICGFEADRDLNAAINLEMVAPSLRETLNACQRKEVAGRSRRTDQCLPMKQETHHAS
jgi:putative transposase